MVDNVLLLFMLFQLIVMPIMAMSCLSMIKERKILQSLLRESIKRNNVYNITRGSRRQ